MYRTTLPLAVLLLLLFSLLPALPPGMVAQTHAGIQLIFPADGQANITLRPEITIVADGPIDPSSVTTLFPDPEANGHEAGVPTIILCESSIEGETNRVRSTVLGTYSMPAENIIVFHPLTLKPGTEYDLVVSGLMTMGPQPSLLPPLEATFTTRHDLPRIVGCSMEDAPLMTCADTITVTFSSPVQDYAADLHRILSIEETAPNAPNGWRHLPFDLRTSTSANIVRIIPHGHWPAGSGIRLSAEMSEMTGDRYDDRTYTTAVRQYTRVKVDVKDINNRPVHDSIVQIFKRHEQAMMAGSNPPVEPIDRREDLWRFVRWDGPLTIEPGVDVTIPCDLLREETNLTAIIEQFDTLRLAISINSGGVVDMYDHTGSRVRTVSQTDTVAFTKADLSITLIARPDSGYVFTGWSAPSTPMHQAAPAAVILNTSTVGQMINTGAIGNNGPTFTPQFQPATPSSEKYRLKAYLYDEDQDAGFDVNDGVIFTTESEYEADFPQFRTVCVQASECWEITGYSISATGEIEYYPPTNRLCVRAELLDPENSITFFVRRMTIMLRVERVVLETDDQNSVRRGEAPHPETYVKLEKRYTDLNGDYDWRPLSDVLCEENGIYFSSHAFKCGDVVRLRTKGSPVRGQSWKFWANKVHYVQPSQTGTTGEERRFEVVIGKDIAHFNAKDCRGAPVELKEIRMQACFRQEFGIEAIGFSVRVVDGSDRSKARFEERWFDPLFYREQADDEPIGGRQVEYVPWHGTIIKVRFTSPVDTRTIFDGGMQAESYNNTLVNDASATGLDFTISSSDGPHISFEPLDGSPLTTVVFRVNDPWSSPRLQALHGGSVDLTVFTSVKSLSGVAMLANATFIIQALELPGFGLQLTDITYKYDGDPDFWFFENDGEIYHVAYGANLGVDKARYTDVGFARIPDCSEQQGVPPGDCTLPHSDKDGPQGYGDKLLWMQPFWMDRNDLAWWHVSTYDEDCKDETDCLVNRVDDILDRVREEVDALESGGGMEELDWPALIPGLIRVGSELIQALLPPDEQDQHIGQGTFLQSASNLWGARSGLAPYVILHDSGAKYRLKARLFVNKSVIR